MLLMTSFMLAKFPVTDGADDEVVEVVVGTDEVVLVVLVVFLVVDVVFLVLVVLCEVVVGVVLWVEVV